MHLLAFDGSVLWLTFCLPYSPMGGVDATVSTASLAWGCWKTYTDAGDCHAAWRARKRLERGEEMLTVRMLETLPGGSEVGAWFSMTAELLMKARTFLWIITV